ncbi:MAG: hypothetical protein BGO78_13985 [Chloroflexi bacterium 44-23]|nr:MAG: hypothetical protein BGO78_13985 [Chloroflexi bacterium 44-23]
METIFFRLTNEMRLNPGVNDSQLKTLSLSLTHPLPDDFISFMKFSNGAIGMMGINYLEIVKAEELIPFNRDYSVESDAPGLFIFGTDGGGEAYGFDFREQDPVVVEVPFIGMDWEVAIRKGDNFLDFLQKLKMEK